MSCLDFHCRPALTEILFKLLLLAMLTAAIAAPEHELGSLNDTSWHKYVRAPSSRTMHPVRHLPQYSNGSITNPDGIVGDGVTTLTRVDTSQDAPSIVLDFGQNCAGILSIKFAGAESAPDSSGNSTTALPGLGLAFSESLLNLSDRSDFTRSDNQAGSDKFTNGTDRVAVLKEAYTWTNQLGCQFGDGKVCSDGFHGFRYVRITLEAVESDAPWTTGFGSVSIDSVSLEFSAYRGTPDTFTGWFECSDEDITQWWYDGVYTNDLATDIFRANDTDPRDAASASLIGKVVLHDGAKRDRDPYVGDLAVAALTLYLSHDNAAAARNVLADLADHQRSDGWIPPASINNYTLPLFDYPLWWVVCSSDLVLYTNDTAYLDKYYPNMLLVLDTYYPSATNAATGLLDKGLPGSGTAGYGDYAFLPRSGPITYYNALYVLALTRAADLADLQHDPSAASRWRARAAAVGPALMRENWDASVGALLDGGPCTTSTGGKCAVHAQDGNALAILSGATATAAAAAAAGSNNNNSVATTTEESMLSFMTRALARPYGNAIYDSSALAPAAQLDQRVYAFISYFEIAARFASSSSSNSAAASAFDELRRLYGWMAARERGTGTFWEGIGAGGAHYQGGYTSLAHGWSTGIVPLASNYVLGVVPTGPGFATFRVRPVVRGGGLAWARGRVPTPWGAVGVRWSVAGDASRLELTVETAGGGGGGGMVGGSVCVPVAEGDARVRMDGKEIWSRALGVAVGAGGVSFEGGHVVVGVEGGTTHVFETA